MKPQPTATGGNRRDFLRHAALGGVAALSLLLGARSIRQKCVNNGLCRGCFAFADCELPSALSAKQVQENNPKGAS